MARQLRPSSSRRRRAVSTLLVGAAALGAATVLPAAATAAPAPTTPTRTPAQADLSVRVDGTASIPANGTGVVGIRITNNGPVAADRVRTLVTLPAGIAIFDATGPYNEQTAGGSTVRFDEPEALGSGETRFYRVFLFSTRDRPSSSTLSASTQSQTLDPALRNNWAAFRVTAEGGLPDF